MKANDLKTFTLTITLPDGVPGEVWQRVERLQELTKSLEFSYGHLSILQRATIINALSTLETLGRALDKARIQAAESNSIIAVSETCRPGVHVHHGENPVCDCEMAKRVERLRESVRPYSSPSEPAD